MSGKSIPKAKGGMTKQTSHINLAPVVAKQCWGTKSGGHDKKAEVLVHFSFSLLPLLGDAMLFLPQTNNIYNNSFR